MYQLLLLAHLPADLSRDNEFAVPQNAWLKAAQCLNGAIIQIHKIVSKQVAEPP